MAWMCVLALALVACGDDDSIEMDAAVDAPMVDGGPDGSILRPNLDHCEYELSSEFQEAMEHSREGRREVKIVLRVDEVGDTYE